MPEELLTVQTRGVIGEEELPDIDFGDYSFLSYFENQEGQQFIFAFDDGEKEGYIYTSKTAWDERTVIDFDSLMESSFTLHFEADETENKWIQSCAWAIQPRFK